MKKWRINPAFFSIILLLLLIGCSAASKSVKLGDDAMTRGNYYAAATDYLEALKAKPKHAKALQKLSEVARPAYEQKLGMAQEYEEQGNLEGALTEYKHLKQYLSQLKTHNILNFVPIDVDKTIRNVSQSAAEEHYQRAESLFNNREFNKAISEYRSALNLARPYKDCREKISESHYCMAIDLEKKGSYRSAAENYETAFKNSTGYKDTSNKAATIYYALGCYFLENEHCRKAYEDFSKVRTIDPEFKDISNKLDEAKDRATFRIAFARFDNLTGKNIAGMALGDFIFDTIKSKLQLQASQFLRVLDREELMMLAQEQRISEGFLSSDLSGPINIEGVDCIILGKLNQVREFHSGLAKTLMNGYYTFWYEEPYIDKKGRQKTRLKSRREKMSFSLFKDKITLNLAGSIKAIEVKTGAVAINHQIAEQAMDEIAYADEFYARHDLSSSNVTLPKDIENLAKARRELKDVGFLVNGMIDSISQYMASEILSTLDRTPFVSDPVALKYE